MGSIGAHAATVDTNFYADIDGNSSVNLPIGSFTTLASVSDALVHFSLFTLNPNLMVPAGTVISPSLQVALTLQGPVPLNGPGQALGAGTSGGPATYTFFGFPLKIRGGTASPIRAVAMFE